MSRVVRTLFAVTLLASIASTASAYSKYPPGPGYRTCPDSVTILQIQSFNPVTGADTTLNACAPAALDTVLGVRGIITGFRRLSTGRIYIARSGADAAYSGLQIYTNAHLENANVYGPTLQIGDSISADGVNNWYLGESQIQGSLGTGSMKVRWVNSGNAVPIRAATTTTIKWTPTSGPQSAFATADPLEGCLVRVEGPLRIARTQAGAGLYAGTNWLCVNSDGSASGDSILIDGYQLPSVYVNAPPLGATMDWVQGILRRTTNAGVDLWCVSVRNGNDMAVLSPPTLQEAYPIAQAAGAVKDTLRLTFDRNVDVTSAENEDNYTLLSDGSTVDNARVVGGSGTQVDLAITDVQARLMIEGITSVGIGAQAAPDSLSGQQTRSFILGLLSCAEVQAPLADSLLADPCLDKSRFSGGGSAWGPRVTVRGVMVKFYPASRLQFMADAAGGARSGVIAYNVPFGMVPDREYLLACAVQEFYGMTELSNPVALIDKGPVAVPAPVVVPVKVLLDNSCDVNEETDNADDYEGRLVRVENVKVVPWNTPPTDPAAGGDFRIVQMPACADTITVSNWNGLCTFDADPGDLLHVNGVLYTDNTYGNQLYPRGDSDITEVGWVSVPGTVSSKVTFSVGPNPSRVTNVRFTLPKQADVDLSVFDLSGRKVATLAKGSLSARSYEYKWDGAGAGAGIYFVRLRVGSETYNLRAVSLK
jgi:hypothetical protein